MRGAHHSDKETLMLYIRRSDGAYVSFEGMAQDKIEWMLGEQNLQCEFIDKETYDAAIAVVTPGDGE
jgi:hypothetical protein